MLLQLGCRSTPVCPSGSRRAAGGRPPPCGTGEFKGDVGGDLDAAQGEVGHCLGAGGCGLEAGVVGWELAGVLGDGAGACLVVALGETAR